MEQCVLFARLFYGWLLADLVFRFGPAPTLDIRCGSHFSLFFQLMCSSPIAFSSPLAILTMEFQRRNRSIVSKERLIMSAKIV